MAEEEKVEKDEYPKIKTLEVEKDELTISETMERLVKDVDTLNDIFIEQRKEIEEQKEYLDEQVKALNELYPIVNSLRYVVQMTHAILAEKCVMTEYEFHSLEATLGELKKKLE